MKKSKTKMCAATLGTDTYLSLADRAAGDVSGTTEGHSREEWREAFHKIIVDRQKLLSLNDLAIADADNDCIAEGCRPVPGDDPMAVLAETFFFDADDSRDDLPIDDSAELIIKGALRSVYFHRALEAAR